jgi:4-hydroxy-2-oxoheptanedioate aldolase
MKIENPVKDKLAAGEVVYGCFVPTISAIDVEILAVAGFDFALLDSEHGPLSAESAYPMILAAEARGMAAFARVGQNDRQVILKLLDVGVSGVMIPQVMNAEQATQAVQSTKYWPDGTRGLAGGRTFDWGLNQPAADLVPKLNDRILSMIQFEHIDALEHLDAILDVPGLDVLFVGPNDLAQSMGHPGQPGHPDVTAIGDQVVARASAKGIRLGTTAATADMAKVAVSRGFHMIVPNSPGLLATAAKGYIDAVRS